MAAISERLTRGEEWSCGSSHSSGRAESIRGRRRRCWLGAHKRLITSPPVAIFPHPFGSDLTFGRYWNYLRKQTFVLESYATKINWVMNRAHFPYIMFGIHLATALRLHSKGYSFDEAVLPSTCEYTCHLPVNQIG